MVQAKRQLREPASGVQGSQPVDGQAGRADTSRDAYREALCRKLVQSVSDLDEATDDLADAMITLAEIGTVKARACVWRVTGVWLGKHR